MATSSDSLFLESRSAISKGSKSFWLASLFLDFSVQRKTYLFYRWCRYCDDQIDEAPSLDMAQERLLRLKRWTREIYEAESPLESWPPEFLGLRQVVLESQISRETLLDILTGFEWDVNGKVYRTFKELFQYCYYVAGAVGLVLTRIMACRELPVAERHADAMGRAMQLVNIARDIKEDFERGRIYLPMEWLSDFHIEAPKLMESHRYRLHAVTHRVLAVADEQFQLGRQGLRYLPFRAGLAVSIASEIYQGIGHILRRQGPSSVFKRAVVPGWKKLYLVIWGSLRFFYFRYFEWRLERGVQFPNFS